ncbi:hypothetical protein M9Y10_036474 [Tritrichomonas musculus]|uniref:DUF659 domain-containing protein n=1 Tax=Tritrichomonas musculus TaxID=1915356 RepID=A0ABR2GV64_9EUKA
MNKDWIKLGVYRLNSKNRKIYQAKCLKCNGIFQNHRYMNDHVKICKGCAMGNQNNIIMPLLNADVPPIEISLFEKTLIEMMVSSDISLNQLINEDFIKIFLLFNIPKEKVPSPGQIRDSILKYSHKLLNETFKLFENKMVSLIIDGTTSWNKSLYQVSIYYPNIVRHHSLIQINPATAENLIIIIQKICQQLSEKNIEVIGVTTDNASNLVSCFEKIKEKTFSNEFQFPIIRFSCAAHTAQLIIVDLKNSSQIFKESIKIISKLITWIRKKKILNYCKENGLKCSPPRFVITRWNSLFNCIQFILNNYQGILETIDYFSNSVFKCPIELNDEIQNHFISMAIVLEPIVKFTNKVQKNFVSAGEVFYQILITQTEIENISSPDTYGLIEILKRKLVERFNETCDSVMAELCFLITDAGRKWWQYRINQYNSIIHKISTFQNVEETEIKWIEGFQAEKQIIKLKLKEISKYLNFNDDQISIILKTFTIWLSMNDEITDEPITYWKSIMPQKVI